jgi:sulfate permease, SulP family
VEALFLIGVMIGTIQVFIAVFRLGDLTRYISESVILGFMVGAAVVLAISQVANFLGVRAQGSGHQNILHRLWLTLTESYPFDLKAIAISAGTVALVLILRKLVRAYSLPHLEMVAVLVVVTAVGFLLGWPQPDAGGITAIAVAGAVPASLPSPHIPEIKFAWVSDFGSSALAIALLGLLEALAAAKSIASQSGQSLDYNRLCLSQELANLAGGFFHCLPGSGSLTRSAINFQAGAVTRMSGVITAIAVGVALLLIAPLIHLIPKAAWPDR